VTDLLGEVGRFIDWANAYQGVRAGEWECDYPHWAALHAAVLGFLARPFQTWSGEELRAVLFALARDNEMQHVAREVRRRHPELLCPLAASALASGGRDARWQLAEELGLLDRDRDEAERLLPLLSADEDEYVRRRSLRALARLGSADAERLALAAWDRPDENQEYARMMALECLYLVGSPHLDRLAAEAERDGRPYLLAAAREFRRAEVGA
jgi:hypothetical protein